LVASSATADWTDIDAPARTLALPRLPHGAMVFAAGVAAVVTFVVVLMFQWAAASWDGLTRFAYEPGGRGPSWVLAEENELVSGAAQLVGVFEQTRFDLAAVRSGAAPVPRLYVATLPQDLATIVAIDERKDVFVRLALPLVLRVNETIAGERQRLLAMKQRRAAGGLLSYAEQQWLGDLARRYLVRDGNLDELLLRVDEIPPSLALAQAAAESGWGTSRIARAGNALFGQKVWGEEGIAPLELPAGEKFKYAAFDGLMEGIGAYARNLNTHAAYAAFREARAAMRTRQDALDGLTLSSVLGRYSTRGADYVSDLQMLIYENWLWAYDRARLEDGPAAHLLTPAI
jgi:Bax protein